MSLRYQIPGRSTAGGMPILGFDANQLMLGSLLYIEPARDAFTRVPTVGDKITNFARGSFSELTGDSMDNADALVTVDQSHGYTARELTGAGAIHGFFDNSEPSAGIGDYCFNIPQSIINYINANASHTFYADAIIRGTHAPAYHTDGNVSAWMVGVANTSAGTGTFFGIRNQCDADLTDADNHIIYPRVGWTDVLLSGRTVWTNALCHARMARSSKPSAFDATATGGVNWIGPSSPGGALQGGQSFIFYSMYIEDCTVSGRSHSEVEAWRAAQYAADFAPGGRYGEDTYTNPATVSW